MATTTEFSEAESAARGYRRLSSLFRPPVIDAKKCYRCKTTVYHAERIGPVHEVVFHRNCFKCCICGQFLTIKNYWSNQIAANDREIYCQTHTPRIGGASVDAGAVGIKRNLDVQKDYQQLSKKLNPEIRFPGTFRAPHVDSDSIAIQRALTAPKVNEHGDRTMMTASIGVDAMHITGAIDAQILRQPYKKNLDKHHYPPNIYKRKKLIEAQKRLEKEHRVEEDELFQKFQNERGTAKGELGEIDNEWEIKLKDLTAKFEKELQRKGKKDNGKIMTVQYEKQKQDLEKNMTLKRVKTREYMSVHLRQKEQEMTSTMVKRQSKQMLALIAIEQEELKKQIQKELAEAASQQAAIGQSVVNGRASGDATELIEELSILEIHDLTALPSPHPPSCRKRELYSDPTVFEELDEQVIKVAQHDQLTYTDLVHQLTENMLTDLEKIRAIYRWITVKDLNMIEFDENLTADTPMGLLRGIKFGTETYHVLFMRLCSYVGICCKEIKGHSKSVGYQPGMKIKENTFQNTWNTVLVDGDWRLMQCNWGARHLVLNKDGHKDKPQSKDQIRYQYDEHYFLTDPDEFIQEFWPYEPEWQLLENPITLEQFENLPFVRSIFFHFGMHFERSGMPAVVEANGKGGADIKIKVPEEFENELVFYYQLRFADHDKKNESQYRGANLERFVYQTMVDNTVMFSIHLPTIGDFFFEMFANKMDETFKTEDDFPPTSPFRLKCACKFRITCLSLDGKMHPLPDCASGEWGPKKAMRHFKIKPRISMANTDESDTSSDTGSTESSDHPDNPKAGIINVEDSIELKFKCPKPLQFVAKLKMNFVEDKVLEPFYNVSVEDNTLIVYVSPPQLGQYGLDIYAKSKDAIDSSTLSHACKYLLNCVTCSNPVDIPIKTARSYSMKEKWGPAPLFEELGLKTLSHNDPNIYCIDTNKCTVEIYVPQNVELSYQFMREPDEDNKTLVTMTADEKEKKVKFSINMDRTGNYMLAIYGRLADEKASSNVYNYLICCRKCTPGITLKSKSGKDKSTDRKKSVFSKKITKDK